jgi:hypothetical protein
MISSFFLIAIIAKLIACKVGNIKGEKIPGPMTMSNILQKFHFLNA